MQKTWSKCEVISYAGSITQQCHQLALMSVGTEGIQCTRDWILCRAKWWAAESPGLFFVTSGSSEFVVCFGSLLEASTYLCDCFCWSSGEILSPLCFWPYCLKAFSDGCVSQVLCCSCTSFSLLDCRIYVATSRSLNWISLTPFSLPSSSDVSIWFSVCTDDWDAHLSHQPAASLFNLLPMLSCKSSLIFRQVNLYHNQPQRGK